MSVRHIMLALSLGGLLATSGVHAATDDAARWRHEAQAVTIVRDDWGIAHVHGKRDADAVFGMAYAQAEDDFNRVEANYLTSLGRTAEAEGESALWQDLRQKLFVDPEALKADYARSPAWLKRVDGCLGGRAQLLPRQPPGGAPARDPALRAVDGVELQRRQHRR